MKIVIRTYAGFEEILAHEIQKITGKKVEIAKRAVTIEGENREIYLNGQLLLEGADGDGNKDWYESATANNVKFEFGIEIDDVIQFIVRA